jgi:hypothetical protein
MGLDGADAVEVLLHLRRQVREALLHDGRLAEDARGEHPAEDGEEGQGGQQQKAQLRRLMEHEGKGDDAREAEHEDEARAETDHLADEGDVVDRPGHQVAGRVFREEARPHQFEVPVEPLAKLEGDLDADLAHVAPAEIEGDVAQHHQAEDRQCGREEARVARRHAVDAGLERERHQRLEDAADIDQRHAAPEPPGVPVDQRQQPPEGGTRGGGFGSGRQGTDPFGVRKTV